MMNRFHWSMISIGVIAFVWWSFFANITPEEGAVYPKEHYLEDISKIYSDLGHAALKRGDLTQAIKSYQETVAMRPTWLEGYDRLGTTYELNNQPEEAIKIYAQAMAINPTFLDYRQYASNPAKLPTRPLHAKPSKSVEWTGQDLTDKKIFVYAERNLSDTIMFCRFLPLLRSKAAQVYFKPQEPLIHLIRQAKLGATLCNNQTNLTELDVDFHASLLSLQHYLNQELEQLNPHAAYLKTSPERKASLHKAFFNNTDVKVGIAWHNDPYKPGSKNIDILPSFFMPLCHIPGIKVYVLQKSSPTVNLKLASEGKVVDLSEELTSFTDTAAAIENLDVLISSDATQAALAGGLYKNTWFLTPTINDWRWLDHWEKSNTVWFDNFKKIHQAPNKNWQPAFNIIAEKLQEMVVARRTS